MHSPLPTNPGSVKRISGRRLAYQLRRIPASWRVRLTLDLIAGRVELRDLTIRQALKITGASLAQLNELRRDKAGCSLRELQHKQRADRLVARVGAADVMAALDRTTQPQAAAAE